MAQKKILVVDDAEFNRDLIAQLLGDEYEVVVAVDGEEGEGRDRGKPVTPGARPTGPAADRRWGKGG